NVRGAVRHARLLREGLAVLDIRRLLGHGEHCWVGLDADDALRDARPGPRREPSTAAEVDDEPRPLDACIAAEQVEQCPRRPGPEPVVAAREPLALVAGAIDQGARKPAHERRGYLLPESGLTVPS